MPASSILWLQQQRRLLELEYEYEKAQFRAQTETAGVTRKIKQGLCWYPLCLGRSYYNSLNQLAIEAGSNRENKYASSLKTLPETYDETDTAANCIIFTSPAP